MATASKELKELYPMYRYMTGYPIECENIGDYTQGGFHPVNLGDLLCNDRYMVHQKLGWGGYSTVWIARDLDKNATCRWVTVKVKKAVLSTEDVDNDPEVRIHKHLEGSLENEDQRYLPRLLNCFRIEGPNGLHNCLVTELLGPSLTSILGCYEYNKTTFRPDSVLKASRQLLQGIDDAHRAGYAHGDISYSNVLFTCNDALDDDDEWLFSTMMNGDPHVLPYDCPEIPWTPNFPRHIVEAPIWPCWEDGPCEAIRLIDWGSAFPVDTRPDSISDHRDMRAPERYLLKLSDWRQDLWKAGCVIYALFYQDKPFRHGWKAGGVRTLEGMGSKLGPLPDKWKGRFEEMMAQEGVKEEDRQSHMAYNEVQLIRDTFKARRQVITTAFEDERSGACDTDISFGVLNLWPSDSFSGSDDGKSEPHALDCLLPVILGLLKYDPDERMSAKDAISIIDQAWTQEDCGNWTDECGQNSEEPDVA